ncbi:MAG: hypothetical protein RRY40_01840 [Oscillospiraceae bacterium]
MRFAVSRPMGGGGGSFGGGAMDGMGMGGEVAAENFILAFFHKLPLWAQGMVVVLLVIAAAWIAGIILGKLYASVRYPDPEKQSIVHPVVKIGFGVAVICCGVWLYSSITKPEETVIDVTNPDGIVTDEGKETPNADGALPDALPEAEPLPEGETAPETEAAPKTETAPPKTEAAQPKTELAPAPAPASPTPRENPAT